MYPNGETAVQTGKVVATCLTNNDAFSSHAVVNNQ